MQYTHFMDKYPTHHIDIAKSATTCTSVDDILSFFRTKVDAHPLACFIAEFDHYAHTKSLPEGEIAENIHAAKHLVFCFGIKLPNPLAMGCVRALLGCVKWMTVLILVFRGAQPDDAPSDAGVGGRAARNHTSLSLTASGAGLDPAQFS